MDRLMRLWRRLLFYLRRKQFDRELAEEMRFHLEMKAQENAEAGMKLEEARYAAQRQFGNQTLLQEVSRDMWGVRSIETLFQDLRYGARMSLKQPGFTLIAALTLALGIGANTAIFSVVNAALLRRLPYDATRLVAVEAFNPQKEKRAYGASPADFWDWQEQSRSFEQLAMHSGGGIGLKESERIEVVSGAGVTVNIISTFGVQPMLGRAFNNEEGLANGPRAVILSHRLWQQRYGGDPQIVGRTLKTNDGAAPVVI